MRLTGDLGAATLNTPPVNPLLHRDAMLTTSLNPTAIGRFLTEPEVRAIVLTLLRSPLRGRRLAQLTGIPVARCFRILRRLQRLGLVEAGTVMVDRRGRSSKVFRAHLQHLHLHIKDGRLRLRLALPKGMVGPRARP